MHTHGSLFVNARAFQHKLDAQTLESSNNEDGFVLNGLFVASQGGLDSSGVSAAVQIHNRPPSGSAAAEESLGSGRENEIKGWINQKNQHT